MKKKKKINLQIHYSIFLFCPSIINSWIGSGSYLISFVADMQIKEHPLYIKVITKWKTKC